MGNFHRLASIALTCAAFGAGGAMAADLGQLRSSVPVLSPSLKSPVAQDAWSGMYFGVQGGKTKSGGGVELGTYSGFLIPLDVENDLFIIEQSDLRGTLSGGLTAGFNRQYGNFVFGVEGDFTFQSLDVTHTKSRIDPNPMIPFFGQQVDSAYTTEFGNYATLRLRAGWAFDRTMVYATAGLAGGEVHNGFSIAIPGLLYQSPDWSKSGLAMGYAVGAGIEHLLTDRVTLKAEGLFIDLDDRVVQGQDPVSFPNEYISYEFETKMMVGRVGLNYRF